MRPQSSGPYWIRSQKGVSHEDRLILQVTTQTCALGFPVINPEKTGAQFKRLTNNSDSNDDSTNNGRTRNIASFGGNHKTNNQLISESQNGRRSGKNERRNWFMAHLDHTIGI